MNVSVSSVGVCLCYVTPSDWNASAAQIFAYFSLAVVLLEIVYFGITFLDRSWWVFVLNNVFFWGLWILFWRYTYLFQSQRPAAIFNQCPQLPACLSAYNLFYDVLNTYGFPDPLSITGFSFGVVYVGAEAFLLRRYMPKQHILFLFAYYILYSIGELALSRLNIVQWFGNLILIFVLSGITFVGFYNAQEFFPDYLKESWFQHIREQRFEEEYINIVNGHIRKAI